jgi:hypothetical protein
MIEAYYYSLSCINLYYIRVRDMSIFTDAAVVGTIVGGSTLLGVTTEAVLHPTNGDDKDFSNTIESSAEVGLGLGLAYLGIKYRKIRCEKV